MKYILDFDHTLMDTDLFSEDATPYKENGLWVTPAIWNILNAPDYLYTDTLSFLQSLKKEDVRILTAMTASLGPEARAFQKVKLAKSNISSFVSDIVFMEGDKGPFVAEMYDGTPTVFVDDRIEHLESAKRHCPEIHAVQIARPTVKKKLPTSTSADIPVVASLDELSKMYS